MLFHFGSPIAEITCASERCATTLRKLLLSADEFIQLLEDC